MAVGLSFPLLFFLSCALCLSRARTHAHFLTHTSCLCVVVVVLVLVFQYRRRYSSLLLLCVSFVRMFSPFEINTTITHPYIDEAVKQTTEWMNECMNRRKMKEEGRLPYSELVNMTSKEIFLLSSISTWSNAWMKRTIIMIQTSRSSDSRVMHGRQAWKETKERRVNLQVKKRKSEPLRFRWVTRSIFCRWSSSSLSAFGYCSTC